MRRLIFWTSVLAILGSPGCGEPNTSENTNTQGDSGATTGIDRNPFTLDSVATGDNGSSTGDRGPISGDGGPSTGDGTTNPEDSGPSTGDGGPSTGDGGPSTGDGGPSTGDGGPSTGDGGMTPGDTGEVPEDSPLGSVVGTIIDGEICENSFDDDGDGQVNEGCPCAVLTRMPCYAGRPDQAGGTRCQYGTLTCDATGFWGRCEGAGRPEVETCNGLDDNCDGDVDEECECPMEGASRSCFAGPLGAGGVGVCRNGSQSCARNPAGLLRWGTCDGMIVPNFESCNGFDDDCDGMVDENCACVLGSSRSCYDGPAGTEGRGVCHGGFQRCLERADGGSVWSRCFQSLQPVAETCNGADDNCDGRSDEDCACVPGEARSCYDGPAGTAGRGMCAAGRMTCGAGARPGACVGQVAPGVERCNGLDDNCDGRVDEGCFCPTGQMPAYRFRPAPATPVCGLQMGDGLPIMLRTCEPMTCPEGRVLAERFDGSTACVAPAPDCLAGLQPTFNREGAWECDRGCEMVVRMGGLFGSRAVCTQRPPSTCPRGCFRIFRPELDQWRCGERCAGGMAGIRLGSMNVCLPCPEPPGVRIRPPD